MNGKGPPRFLFLFLLGGRPNKKGEFDVVDLLPFLLGPTPRPPPFSLVSPNRPPPRFIGALFKTTDRAPHVSQERRPRTPTPNPDGVSSGVLRTKETSSRVLPNGPFPSVPRGLFFVLGSVVASEQFGLKEEVVGRERARATDALVVCGGDRRLRETRPRPGPGLAPTPQALPAVPAEGRAAPPTSVLRR